MTGGCDTTHGGSAPPWQVTAARQHCAPACWSWAGCLGHCQSCCCHCWDCMQARQGSKGRSRGSSSSREGVQHTQATPTRQLPAPGPGQGLQQIKTSWLPALPRPARAGRGLPAKERGHRQPWPGWLLPRGPGPSPFAAGGTGDPVAGPEVLLVAGKAAKGGRRACALQTRLQADALHTAKKHAIGVGCF